MDKEEFLKYVEQSIKAYLPREYHDLIIEPVNNTKPNRGDVHGLNIYRKGERMRPVLYLDEPYEKYLSGEISLFHIMGNLANALIEAEENKMNKDVNSMIEKIGDYEAAKEHLCLWICECDSNKEYLQKRIYTRAGDFAFTYHVLLKADESGAFSIPVTDDLLEGWGKTKEELHQDALLAELPENRPVLYRVEELMRNMLKGSKRNPVDFLKKDSLEGISRDEVELWTLTNERRLNGAAMIAHQEVLEKIGKVLGEDYYVIPSSQHEVILVQAEGTELAHLHEVVKEVNRTKVDLEDWLSDKVQYYDTKTHVLENAKNRSDRLEKQRRKQSEKTFRNPKYPVKEFGPAL